MSDEERGRRAGEEGRGEHEEHRRGRLESLIPSLVKKALSQGVEALSDEKIRETVVAEVVRKALTKGADVVDTTEDQVRRWLSDLPLPKEVGDRITARLDDYKAELFRVVKEEVHEFLDRVDLGHELQKMLTSLSFEISTEIRFVPNEKGVGKASIKPDVKSSARVKRTRRKDEAKDEE